MQNQLDELEQAVFDELGRQGCERLARTLYENGHYDTEQRARGHLSKCANPNSDNALHLKHAKRIIRACRGRATWLDDLIVYRAQVQAEFAERRMLAVRTDGGDRRRAC